MMQGHDNRSALRFRDRAAQVLKARLAQSAASLPFDQRVEANDQAAGNIGNPVDQPLSRHFREVPESCTQPLATVMISGHDQNPPPQALQFCPRKGVAFIASVIAYVTGDEYGIDRTDRIRSEEHTSELQSLMRISYAVFCLKQNNTIRIT